MISGAYAGGIAGEFVGFNGGTVHITKCYSTGNIDGSLSGGICGTNAGHTSGKVYIKHSYSTGCILSGGVGGILGLSAGSNKGYINIQECFSTGTISAGSSGGICGGKPGNEDGEVHIINCYTRGDIDGENAGGITGGSTGGSPYTPFGDVYIYNTYASGILKHTNAGGIIGNIESDFQGGTIRVQYSVYNNVGEKIIGQYSGNQLDQTGNSNNLVRIQGQLYRHNGLQRWDNDTWFVNGTNALPILRFQLPPSPSPSPTSTVTITPTASKTASQSPTPSRTSTRTATRTVTGSTTDTPTRTSIPTATSSMTAMATLTSTMTSTSSRTATPTSTTTRSGTSSRTATPTSTTTRTATSSRTTTPTPTGTATGTSSSTTTPTTTSTTNDTAIPTESLMPSHLTSCSSNSSTKPYSEGCILENLNVSTIAEIDALEKDHQFFMFQSKLPHRLTNSTNTHYNSLLPYLSDRTGYSVLLGERTVCIVAGLRPAKRKSKSSKYSSDVCCSESNGTAFCISNPIGIHPRPRAFASSWSNGKEHYVFGGQGEFQMDEIHGLLGDLWEYDMDLGEWTMVSIGHGPSARRDSSTWVVADSFLLFGGYGVAATGHIPKYLDDLWKLQSFSRCEGRKREWTRLESCSLTGSLPTARRQASVTVMNSVALLFGGEGVLHSKSLKQPYLSDLWALEFCDRNETWGWKKLILPGVPCGLGGREAQFCPLARSGKTRNFNCRSTEDSVTSIATLPFLYGKGTHGQ